MFNPEEKELAAARMNRGASKEVSGTLNTTHIRLAAKDWRVNPILAPNLKGLPRTHIVIAEYDWERDESTEYAKMLEEAGVEVTKKCYMGVPHAFGHYNHPEKGLSQSRLYLEETAKLIAEVHSQP